MGKYPDNLLYSRDHAWIKVEGEEGTIGLTDFAQQQLSNIIYVSSREPGEQLAADEPYGMVESVKAVCEQYMPVAGMVRERNELLQEEPDMCNSDPYGDGWIIRIEITQPSQLGALMGAAAYTHYIELLR